MGLAITKSMELWAEILRHRAELQSMPKFLISASGLIVFWSVMSFGGLWTYRDINFTVQDGPLNIIIPVILMMPLLAMYLAVSVLSPKISDPTTIAISYENSSRPFFIAMAIAVASSVIPDFLPGVIWHPDPLPSLVVALFIFGLAIWKNTYFHVFGHAILWLIASLMYLDLFWIWINQ